MWKIGLSFVFSLGVLAGCGSTTKEIQKIPTTKPVVIKPSPSMYRCPRPPKIKITPEDPLTNKDVAELIARLKANNEICYSSLKSIRRFLDQAESKISESKSK